MAVRIWLSFSPVGPAKGCCCCSSWKPGASPTIIRSALGSPVENTRVSRRLWSFFRGGQVKALVASVAIFSLGVFPLLLMVVVLV